jgi:hypothetical protein
LLLVIEYVPIYLHFFILAFSFLMNKKHLVPMIIGGIVIAAVFFFIGLKVGGHKKPTARGGAGAYGMMRGGPGGMRGAGFATGTILSIDATSITIQSMGTGTKTIYFTSATPVMKSISGSTSDLKVGETVMVNGTPNADGSIAAQSVSIRPAQTNAPAQSSAPAPAGY